MRPWTRSTGKIGPGDALVCAVCEVRASQFPSVQQAFRVTEFMPFPRHRAMVADMLRAQAMDPRNPSQFIVTTFHPQIVSVADKVYGVSHSNRISR